VNGYDQIMVIRTAGTPSRWARRAAEPLSTVAELKMRRPMPEELPDPVNLYSVFSSVGPSGLTGLNRRDQVTTVHRSGGEAVKGLQTGGLLSSCLPAALCAPKGEWGDS
jgi:hypothetical protein